MKKLIIVVFVLLPQKLGSAFRRFKYGILFENHAVRIGPRARFVGHEHIEIEGSFEAGGGLWIDAIVEFAGTMHQPRIVIGHGFVCSESVHIGCIQYIQIGRNVLVGSKTLITDHTHGSYATTSSSAPSTAPFQRRLYSAGPVCIGDNVFIGDNCVIQAGVAIGDGAVVAANSVVTRNVAAGEMVAGIPATIVKSYDPVRGEWQRVKG